MVVVADTTRAASVLSRLGVPADRAGDVEKEAKGRAEDGVQTEPVEEPAGADESVRSKSPRSSYMSSREGAGHRVAPPMSVGADGLLTAVEGAYEAGNDEKV